MLYYLEFRKTRDFMYKYQLKNKLLILLSIYIFSTLIINAKTIKDTYKSRFGNDIKIEITSTKNSFLKYTIYEDNIPLSNITKKSKFQTCKINTIPDILAIKKDKRQIGWLIVMDNSCHTPNTFYNEIVLPKEYKTLTYVHKSFYSNAYPLIVQDTYNVNIWFCQKQSNLKHQSKSFFLPQGFKISYNEKITNLDLLKNITFLEEEHIQKCLKPTFLGLFHAGLKSKNLHLMHYALEKYYKENEVVSYKNHLANPSKANLLKVIEETKIPLNQNYMQYGYCYGIDKPDKGMSGTSEIYDNLPVNFPPYYLPESKGLELRAFPNEKSIFKKSYKGFKLILANTSDKNITLSTSDSRFPIVMQGKTENGEWKNIEFLPRSWCGNSYGTKILKPQKAWVFTAPIYKGNTKVKLRFKMEDIISNEFNGEINMGQFTNKKRNVNDEYNYLYDNSQFPNEENFRLSPIH